MHTVKDIRQFGLSKLAEDEGLASTPNPQMLGRIIAAPSQAMRSVSRGTFSAPTPQEARDMNAYVRSGIVGGLAGSAVGALIAAITKRPMLPRLGVGLGAGTIAGVARHYDQSSDPPGLSPVYTIPSGLRLGALAGGLAGLPLGKLTGIGALSGMLRGAVSGGVAGGAVSNFV